MRGGGVGGWGSWAGNPKGGTRWGPAAGGWGGGSGWRDVPGERPAGSRLASAGGARDAKALVEQGLDGGGERLGTLLGRGRPRERAGGDLDLRQRQPSQLAERRACGAEAVDAQAEAADAQAREDVEGGGGGRRAA